MKELGIGEIDLSGFPSELLLAAIRKLEVISFHETTFTAAQMNAILSMISEGRQGKLRRIIVNFPEVQGTVCQELLLSAKQVEGLLHYTEREEEGSEVYFGDFEVSDAE